jgi:uncharacterized protein YndB with AHSA1/START domain
MATAQVTPDDDTILAEIVIAAPQARVFEAIFEPRKTTHWWGKQDCIGSPKHIKSRTF